MKKNVSEFDMIQKAIYHTYDVLENECADLAVDEMKAAREHYLLALSHKTLIDKQYLKRMIE
ncbi:DUF3921 family protein [Ectobacillus panaciterrae]|uniref:DUF3921 family protein n=1 Tax=Ectobacillus panaciterrae TaxID=363872 RepID=UPI0004192B97|nr:DUF3921 family protein [Ectobacillus panaciterrae]